ncbi:tetratricopeptide repeat protein [Candidatus Riflebacteria bacterium]
MLAEEEAIAKSISLFEQLVEKDSSDTFSLRQLSKLYFRNNQPEKTVECYQKILELDPEDTWTLKRLGEKHQNEKNWDAAIDCYNSWIEADPYDGEPKMKKLDAYKDKVSEDEDNKGKIFFNELKKYKDMLDQSNDSFASFEAGYAHMIYTTGYTMTEEEMQTSMACFKQGISQDSENLWCYWGLKMVFIKVSLSSSKLYYNDAIKMCKKALEVEPDSARGHFELAGAYNENYEANMKSDAIKEYRLAISLDPEFVEAYFGLAGIYRMKRMYDKAIETYQMVLDIDPTGNLARDSHRSLIFIERNKEGGGG